MRKPDSTEEMRSLFPLIEESTVLLRRAPPHAWAVYLLGGGPFALAFVQFWATFSGRNADAPAWAFLMVALHVWMRMCQSRFSAILFDTRGARGVVAWPLSAWRRAGVNQLLYGAPCFVGLLPAALVMIPYGWLFAFYQSLAVNAHQADGARRAWEAARHAPYQNHLLLGWLSLCWMVLFLNVSATLVLLPYGIKWLFPVEWTFMNNPFWFFNTTFLCAVTMATYLLLDPLVKAAYVLRMFHGLSRKTGEDLRTDWRRLRAPSVTVAVALLLAGVARAAPYPPSPDAVAAAAKAVPIVAVAPPGDGAVSAEALGDALSAAAGDPRYTWRKPVDLESVPQAGWIEKYVRKPIEKCVEFINRMLGKLNDWLDRKGGLSPRSSGSGISGGMLKVLLWGGVALVAGGLLFMLWRLRKTRGGAGLAVAVPRAAAAPDVTDESVTAEALPEDEWLRLAEQFCAGGEYRKAARAFFLACLACLARREWVTIKRSKTNADYLREMRRRALGRVFDEQPFCAAVGVFEAGWYGEHPVTAEALGAMRLSVEAYRE